MEPAVITDGVMTAPFPFPPDTYICVASVLYPLPPTREATLLTPDDIEMLGLFTNSHPAFARFKAVIT